MNQNDSISKVAGGGRNSSLELFRLLSMFMVLILHSFWGYTHGSGILQALDFFSRLCGYMCCECILANIRLFWNQMEI